MGSSCTVSEIYEILATNCESPTTHIFKALLRGFPLKLCDDRRMEPKNLNDWATRERKKFHDIFSCFDGVWRTERRTDTGRRLVPGLRIASRGNGVLFCDIFNKTYVTWCSGFFSLTFYILRIFLSISVIIGVLLMNTVGVLQLLNFRRNIFV